MREFVRSISKWLIGTNVMISLVRGVRGFNWTSSWDQSETTLIDESYAPAIIMDHGLKKRDFAQNRFPSLLSRLILAAISNRPATSPTVRISFRIVHSYVFIPFCE